MKNGDVVKHYKFMDVAIIITEVIRNDRELIKFKGKWVNIGFNKSYMIKHQPDVEIEIHGSDKLQWFVCKNKNSNQLRNELWMAAA